MTGVKVFAAALALTAALSGPGLAGDPQDVANRVSQNVMSPFCDGLTLHDCPSAPADELRLEIVNMAERGMTEAAIIDELEERYGSRIRAVPPAEGTNLLAWIAPGLVVGLGVAAALLLARRFSKRRATDAAPETTAPQTSPEDRARLDAELSAFREETT
jgi:cytochrome c-type biogenesis protein CcmH